MMLPIAPTLMPETTTEAFSPDDRLSIPVTPPAVTETRSVGLRLPTPLFDRLKAAAAADRRSMNSMAALLLEDALDRRS